MSKSFKKSQSKNDITKMDYADELKLLQIELVKLQREIISQNMRILVIFEGRDAAGKDGTIKRIIEHLSPRETRVVALGTPTDRERQSWYYQRYTQHLPSAQEMVLFNRSWYNRAGVEHVFKFCSKNEYEVFIETVGDFEQMLVMSEIKVFKYYLDISREEQKKRLRDREQDPLTQWKSSPLDKLAQKHWKDYSRARDSMLLKTHHEAAPWTIVRADDKHQARLNVIKDILGRMKYKGKSKSNNLMLVDPGIVFPFEKSCLTSGLVAP